MKYPLIALLLALHLVSISAYGQQRHDTELPVEITADNLSIAQRKQQATFTGNVEAVQGDIYLNSDKMVVHYKRKESEEGTTKQGVSKIEVFGDVKMTNTKETAQGDEGIYDVEKQTIFLKGNVILTQQDNVVKGDNLVYNLRTGKSQIKSNRRNGTSTGEGRVRGVFVPE